MYEVEDGQGKGRAMQAPTHPPVKLPAEEQVGEEATANDEVEQILHFNSDEDMWTNNSYKYKFIMFLLS